jgi:hypothetical protein
MQQIQNCQRDYTIIIATYTHFYLQARNKIENCDQAYVALHAFKLNKAEFCEKNFIVIFFGERNKL